MAKKNNTEEKTNGKPKSGSFLKDERFKVTLGILISAFGILLFISFVSYLFTWKTDQSFAWSRVFSEPDYQVDNWSGKIGAYFSNLFMNRWFGIASFAVPFLLFLIGLRLMRVKIPRLGRIIRITVIGFLLLSIWLGFILRDLYGILGSGLGGKHGLYVSDWMKSFAGLLGAFLILLAVTMIYMVFSYKNTLNWIEKLFAFRIKLPSKSPRVKNAVAQPAGNEATMPSGGYDDLVFETEFNRHERQGKPVIIAGTEPAEDDVELVVETPDDNTEPVEVPAEKYDSLEDYDPTLDLPHYKMPTIELLEKHDTENSTVTNEELVSNKNKIVETLAHYISY